MEKEANKMKVAIIPAYNDESTIGSVVLKTKQFVDKVIVIDDHSLDDTSKVAKLAGAEVVVNEKKFGKSKAIKTGFQRALELNPSVVVTLDADYSHNPEEIPMLISAIQEGNHDISIGYRIKGEDHDLPKVIKENDEITGFRAFSYRAVKTFSTELSESDINSEPLHMHPPDVFKIEKVPIEVQWLPSFKRYDEGILNNIEKLNTTNEIYNEKRKVQKKLSKFESYRLVCETFLKFIPPAMLSLIVSLTIIIPATNIVNIQIGYVLIIGLITLVTFLLSWVLLILLLDKIYQNSTYLEALDRRLKQKEDTKKNIFNKNEL